MGETGRTHFPRWPGEHFAADTEELNRVFWTERWAIANGSDDGIGCITPTCAYNVCIGDQVANIGRCGAPEGLKTGGPTGGSRVIAAAVEHAHLGLADDGGGVLLCSGQTPL